jgi:hypothetical protein
MAYGTRARPSAAAPSAGYASGRSAVPAGVPTPCRPFFLEWLLVGVAVLPLLVAATQLVGLLSSGWTPIRDEALLELHTADVGRQPVLLGPYSRFGWHHPGPSLFYLMALPYHLTGRSSVALPLAAVGINLVAAVGIAAVAFRRGGRALLVPVLLLLELYFLVLGPWVMRSSWNPYVSILPFALFLVLAWSSACGDRWCLPLTAGVGSFIVQNHVGYIAVVAAVLGVSTLWSIGSGGTRRLSRHVLAAAAVLVVLWLPPVVEQLMHEPGNLGLLRSSLSRVRPTLTPLEGAQVALVRLGAIPAWVTGTSARPGANGAGASLWPGALSGLVLAGGGVAAWRQARRDRLRLAILAAGVFALCAWTAGRIEGRVEPWLVEWMAVPGIIAWALAGWMVLERLGRVPKMYPTVTLVAGTALVAIAGVNATAALDAGQWRPGASDTVSSLEHQLRPGLAADERPALLTFGPGASQVSPMGWGAGLVLALEKHDIDVRIDPRWQLQFGEDRTDTTDAGARLTLTTDPRFTPAQEQFLVASADGVFVYRSE